MTRLQTATVMAIHCKACQTGWHDQRMLNMLRKLFFILWALVALFCPVQAALSAEGQPLVPDADVKVQRSGGSFTVDTIMFTPVPPALAWAVLTDFEHMGGFVPNLTSSQVLERSDALLKVAQKGVARFG